MEKMKKVWDEKHESVMDQGESLIDKGINLASDSDLVEKGQSLVSGINKETVNNSISKISNQSDKLLDKALENKDVITKQGLSILETIKSDESAKKILNKGLTMMKQVEDDGGVEVLIEKGKNKLNELRSDDSKRDEFITSLKDTALNFLLQYLPKVQVPVINGEKSGIKYQIENINLGGFHVRTSHVKVALDLNKGSINGAILRLAATKITFNIKDLKWSYKKVGISGSGYADCFSKNVYKKYF